jgi:D-serine deaminase-like pyridoxal phosphate-dependent protein
MHGNIEPNLATPALVIDLGVVDRNLVKMAEYCRLHRLNLRPHAKTHKSQAMGRRQMDRGASGLTVAKAGEAAVMSAVCGDILVAYPVIDAARADRLADLARRITVRVAIDSTRAADALAKAAAASNSTLGILVDLDVGFHRTGLPTPQAAAALSHHVKSLKHLRLDGLMCYPGHICAPMTNDVRELHGVSDILGQTITLLDEEGLSPTIVSGGSTPTALISHLVPQLTEIRPGTYIYNDWNTVSAGYCSIDDCAARVLCRVVSDAVTGKVVIDAGSKTLASDRLITDAQGGGFGHLVGFEGAKIVRLTEEHGEIDISRCRVRPQLGERVWVIPNHVCPCVNLQDTTWLRHPAGELEPLPTDARGMVT